MKKILLVLSLTTFLFCFANSFELHGSNVHPSDFSKHSNVTSKCGAFTPIYWINAGTTAMNTLNFGAPMADYIGNPILFGCRPVTAMGPGGIMVSFEYFGSADYQNLINDYDSYDEETIRRMMVNSNSNMTSALISSTRSNNSNFDSFDNTYLIPDNHFPLLDRTTSYQGDRGAFIAQNRYDDQNRVIDTEWDYENVVSSLISETTTKRTTREQQRQERIRMGVPLIADLISITRKGDIPNENVTESYGEFALPEQATTTDFLFHDATSDVYNTMTYDYSGSGLINQYSQIFRKMGTQNQLTQSSNTLLLNR